MPDLPWFNEEEGIQRLREIGKLEGVCLLLINFIVVALQCCVSFCYGTKWISYTFTYTPTFLDFLPIYVTTEPWVEFPGLYGRFSLVTYFIHSINSACTWISISQFGLSFKTNHPSPGPKDMPFWIYEKKICEESPSILEESWDHSQ